MKYKPEYSTTFIQDKNSLAYKDKQTVIKKREKRKKVSAWFKSQATANKTVKVKRNKKEQSLGAFKVEQYLIKTALDYIKEKKFRGMKGVQGGSLRIDFFLPKLNIAIEFDGEQHYKFCKEFHKTKQDFLDGCQNDRNKDAFCKQKGIEVIRIREKHLTNLECILNGMIQKLVK